MQGASGKSSAGMLVVSSLTVAFVSAWLLESLTGIFLIDVAITFFGSSDPVSIATVSQLVTISSVTSVAFGFLLGALSVRLSYKKLLFFGVLAITTGILGCFLAPNFSVMQIFYPVEGIGTVAVGSMVFAIVGESLILSKRGKAAGWITAGPSIAGIAAALAISFFFSGVGGWRSYLLWFALPISLLSLTAVYFGVPSSPGKPRKVEKKTYLDSYKQVFLKKSASGCLIGNMIRHAGWTWVVVYSATFFRIQFGLSLESGALFVLGVTAISALGNILGGQLVNRVGRKRLVITTLVISSPALALVSFVPNLLCALVLGFASAFIYSMGFAGGVNLTLEQLPELRGTMMSMSTIFMSLGVGIGAALGGVALAVFRDYTALVLTFVTLQLTAAAIYYFLTKDPCRTGSSPPQP